MINCKIVTKKSKKTGKEFECLEINIRDYTKLVFVDKYELAYIKHQLDLINAVNDIRKRDDELMKLADEQDKVNSDLF